MNLSDDEQPPMQESHGSNFLFGLLVGGSVMGGAWVLSDVMRGDTKNENQDRKNENEDTIVWKPDADQSNCKPVKFICNDDQKKCIEKNLDQFKVITHIDLNQNHIIHVDSCHANNIMAKCNITMENESNKLHCGDCNIDDCVCTGYMCYRASTGEKCCTSKCCGRKC